MPTSTTRKPPLPVVAALILEGGRWLIARRPPHKHLGGKWEFPGGKVDEGETPEDALVREIREELGCTIRTVRRLPSYDFDYGAVVIRMIPIAARLEPGPRPVALEHTELAWSDDAGLRAADLAPADLPLLDALPGLLAELSSAADARR